MVYFVTMDCWQKARRDVADLKNEIIIYDEEVGRIQKEIQEFEKKIKYLKEKLKSSTLMLENLQERLKERNEIVLNSKVVRVVVVDDERNRFLSNGLVDVNRDILMKLIRISRDWQKMRNVCDYENVDILFVFVFYLLLLFKQMECVLFLFIFSFILR